jgi:hypothetical protein
MSLLRKVALIFAAMLVAAEASAVQAKASEYSHFRQRLETVGGLARTLIDSVHGSVFGSVDSAKATTFASAIQKLGGAKKIEEKIGAMVLAEVDWRGVEDHREQPTYYDRISRFVGIATNQQQDDESQVAADNSDDCPEGTTRTPCTVLVPEQDDSFRAMSSYRNSLPINEAHSVSASFLILTAMLFFAVANKMQFATLFRVASQTTTSSRPPPKGTFFDNSVSQASCSSGNFFLGFGVASLFLAFLFAPTAAKEKMFAAGLLALTAGAIPAGPADPMDKGDYVHNDMLDNLK